PPWPRATSSSSCWPNGARRRLGCTSGWASGHGPRSRPSTGPFRPERLTRVTGPSGELRGLIERALAEDAPSGDLTTELTIPQDADCTAELRAKVRGVLAGVAAAQAVFDVVASQDGRGPIQVEWHARDGDPVGPGDVVAALSGPARSILRAERVAVNLLAHLSGVATLTSAFVRAAAPARVLCTRKTTPGLRAL